MAYEFATDPIPSNWRSTFDKATVDEATRTVTIAWRVRRPRRESATKNVVGHRGRDFGLGPGEWKVHLVDASSNRVLGFAHVRMKKE